MDEQSPLFQPLRIGGVEIAGRVIKTATAETRAAADGTSGADLAAFYEPMAVAGTPLIITGNIYISRDGRSTPRQPGADDDGKIAGLAKLTDMAHRHGSRIFAQLSHCGRQVVPSSVGLAEAVSASDVKELMLGTRPRPLTTEEIARIVADFAAAARRCKAAGFDGVQLHAAHGYLIGQFLTPYTNRREDAYGGSVEGRTRFLREILYAVRAEVGPDYPVILKLNGSDELWLRDGLKTPDLVEIATIMAREGVDAVEVSVGHYESGFPVVRGRFWRCLRGMVSGSVRDLPQPRRLLFTLFWPLMAPVCNLIWRGSEGYNLAYARRFKATLPIPVIVVGGFLTRRAMEDAIRRGDCDAVSAGRAFIADPHLWRHLKAGVEGPRCVRCNACAGRIGAEPLDCLHPEVRRAKDAMLAAYARGAS